MIKLPFCSTKNTVIDGDMAARHEAGQLVKIVVYMVPEGKVLTQDDKEERCFGFLAAHFSDEPVRPMFLATRRMRKMPKLFVDSRKMLANVYRDYPGIPVQTILPETGPSRQETPYAL